MGILFQNYFSEQYKYISASVYLAVTSSYFSHHSSGLASPIRIVIWNEILNYCLEISTLVFVASVRSSATQGGNLHTSGEYAKVFTKPPKILAIFYTIHSIFLLHLLFLLSCCSVWDKKMYIDKALKREV